MKNFDNFSFGLLFSLYLHIDFRYMYILFYVRFLMLEILSTAALTSPNIYTGAHVI